MDKFINKAIRIRLKEIRDELFNIANSYAGDEHGHIACRLHGISNSVYNIRDIMEVLYPLESTPPDPQHGREPDKVKQNGLVPMPKEWIGQYYNACTEPCDMLCGPCICGAWHHLNEWIINRKKLTKDGWQEPVKTVDDCMKPLAQYLAEYLNHEGDILPADIGNSKDLLEQAFGVYESTEQVKIRIERV